MAGNQAPAKEQGTRRYVKSKYTVVVTLQLIGEETYQTVSLVQRLFIQQDSLFIVLICSLSSREISQGFNKNGVSSCALHTIEIKFEAEM